MAKLDGKIAVITGGSSGIGLATAKRFVEEGAYVFITGRRQSELDKAKAFIGKNVTAVQGDVTKRGDIVRLYNTVKEQVGHLDIVFANAGVGGFTPLGEVTDESFDADINLNLRAVLFTVQEALPLLRQGSSVILSGSIAGAKGFPGMSVYGAAKAGVRSFARTWTAELKARGIRVNVLSPGPVATPPFQAAPKEAQDQFAEAVPIGRVAQPEEIAGLALYLASDESSFVAGSEFFVDGGLAQI